MARRDRGSRGLMAAPGIPRRVGRRFATVVLAVLLLAVPAALGVGPFSPSLAAAQDVVFTEILAAGGDLEDEDGDAPDWIEIQNRGPSEVGLEGWFLTDDAAYLTKWRFPAVVLSPGAYLVVFASGKDRSTPGEPLHASFRLSSEGEFLALVEADGRTVADAFAPAFPEQLDGISYGVVQEAPSAPLVAEGAPARWLVPTAEIPAGWGLPGFDDAAWTEGRIGMGFDAGGGAIPPPGGPVNIAPEGTASQSSEYGGGQYGASLAIDGEYESFTHTAAGQNLPAAWDLDLGEARTIASIVLHNRRDCCRSRLRDVTVSILDAPGGAEVYRSALLNPENVLGGGSADAGPVSLTIDLLEDAGGSIRGRAIRVVRTPDPDLSGTDGQGNPDEADVLSLSEVEVFEGIPGFLPWIRSDVGAAMRGVSASLWVRMPFDLEDAAAIDRLRLLVRYDDGFVAYLNGAEIARRNAPASPSWDSSATAENPDAAAVVPEDIDLGAFAGALRAGPNSLAVHALNVSHEDDDLLILPELVAGLAGEETWAYFRTPTPGAPNGTSSIMGFVADTKFSHDRGFHEEPFDLRIATATPGAMIRYTLDGSPPTETTGAVHDGPIHIDRTSTVRARAFVAGLEPTNVDTHTYIFVGDVVRQTASSVIAEGFPRTWGGFAADYGLDPKVIGPSDLFGGIYAATIRDDLKSLPTMSIVLKTDDMFGARGIYTNSTAGGIAWERPASVELIHPDRDDGFQVDCGIRIQGGYFRQMGATRKHSFRLLFKEAYGPTKLRYPLFGPRAARSFDTITLRAGANDGYSWDAARLTEQYTRDEFGRGLQVSTGNAGSRGTFVHLYVNGIYWGLYNPAERPDHSFSATYYGGEKDDWDAVHDSSATNGDLKAWGQMITACGAARTSLEAYMRLQGRNPDGTPSPVHPHLLDVPNYVDYLIVNLWGGNWDWPWKNWWAGRDRTAASTGFKFYSWDYENTMGNNRDRSPLGKNALLNDFSGAGQPHTSLATNPEYKLLFADRVQRLLLDGGILTPGSLLGRYEALASRVERSIVGESARWGDQHSSPPLTLREWRAERDWILGQYLPRRTAVALAQLEAAGLYPAIDPPRLNRRGGLVDAGFRATVTAPAGTVYHTLDGSDPRLVGGGVSPGAAAAEVRTVTIVPPDAALRSFVPADGSLGLAWTEPDFDDASWSPGQSGIGFDERGDYAPHIRTDLLGAMNDVATSIYVRIPFDLDPALFAGGALVGGAPVGAEPAGGSAAFAVLTLEVKFDDGYVAYLNGARIAARNAPPDPLWDSRASASHADSQAVVPEAIDVPEALGLLRPGRNVLALQGLNSSLASDDFLLEPRLVGVPASEGIEILRTTSIKARALVGSAWSALVDATFIVDTPVRITEVMYHPAYDAGAPPAGSRFEEGDFEFVELQNVGSVPVDLTGLRLEGGITFDFEEGAVERLGPGEIVVVVKNLDAFASRYLEAGVPGVEIPAAGILVAGQYRGRLDNRGDFLILRGVAGEAILDFDFLDAWVPETDGLGPSLVIADATGPAADWMLASSWRASAYPLGSPGVDESGGAPQGGLQLAGDINQDAILDIADPVALLGHLFLGSWPTLPCGTGGLDDLGNRTLLDANGDGDVALSDAVYVLNYLFLGGAEPVLGTDCVRIRGCPGVCR